MSSNRALTGTAFATLLLIALMMGANHVAARIAFNNGVDVATAVVFRSVITALVIVLILALQRARVPVRFSPRHKRMLPLIGLLIGVQSLCLYSAVARLPVALAHFVRFAFAVRTTAMRMLTKRAARAAVKAVLLRAAEARHSPPGHSLAESLLLLGAQKTRCLHLRARASQVHAGPQTKTIDSRASVPGSCAGLKTQSLHSRKLVPGRGDLCGGKEHRAGVGARSVLRKHSYRSCPNGESKAHKVGSAVRPQPEHRSAGYTQCDRHRVSPRRVPTSATRPSCREAAPATIDSDPIAGAQLI